VPRFLTQPPPGPPITERLKRLLNLEEVLGTNYLIKIGVVILVIGVAGFIVSKFGNFPTWAQLSAGYLVGLAMLIGGARYETSPYRILARSSMGGGWALIFFTTWALHHAHHPGEHPLLPWEPVDLVLMLIVAAAMVKHTLKYNSQLVTGFAFLLPSLTVTVTLGFASNVTDTVRIPGLVASAILALGLVVIVVRRRWFEMEVFGIVSTYLNHFFWMRPIVEQGPSAERIASLYWSATLLIAYWAIFRGSYIIRKVDDTRQEAVSTVAGLLNTFLLLGLLKYQAMDPKQTFWFLLALGAVELTLGQLPVTKRRRAAFVILTTLGACFLVAAPLEKFSGPTLPVILLAETEAFFLAGVFTREIVFRRLGMLAGLLVALDMDWLALRHLTHSQFHGLVGTDALKATVVYGLAALVFYGNSHWVARRWLDLIQSSFEDWSFRGYSYIAGSVAFLGLWLIFPSAWVPVAWSALALGLAVAGQRLKIRQLVTQVPFFTAAATLGVFAVNFSATGSFLHLSLRLVTVSLVAAMFYLTSRWERRAVLPDARLIAEAHTWVATALLAVLVWYECPGMWCAVGWSAMALTLALAGRGFKLREFSDQAHFLAGAGFVAALEFTLLNLTPHHHERLPLEKVLLTAVLLYACSRHIRLTRLPGETLLSAAHSWTATLLLALLPWYALRAEFAAPAWMVLAFAGAVVGRALKLKRFSFQAYGLAFVAFAGALFVNLPGTSPPPHDLVRLVAVSFVAALLYVCSRWAALSEITGADKIRAIHTWMGTALVALLAWYEAPELWTAVAWAALALILIFLGQRTKHLDLSIQGFILTTAALIGTLSVNLLGTPPHWHDGVRLITVVLVVSLIYLSLHWTKLAGAVGVAVGQAWGASAVLALLPWYELPKEYAAPAWIVLALALAAVGRTFELKRFSFQSYMLALAAFLGAVFLNLAGTGPHTHDMLRLVAVSIVAALLYVCSRWAALVEFEGAREISALHTWLGTGLLAALAWYETPCDYTAPIWCGMALALVVLGSTLKRRSLAVQGHCLAAAGIVSALTVNLYSSATLGHFDGLLLATVGICVAFLYLCSPWSGSLETAKQWQIPEAYTWAASTLLFLLIWYELQPVAVAVAWALFGIVLFELGFGQRSNSLRWQSYAALGGSFARMFYVNINATGNPGEISPRVWTMLFLAAAFFYVYARLAAGTDDSLQRDRKLKAPPLLCYFGSITVAALMRAELDPNWVVVAWAAMIVGLLALAWKLHRRIFLEQGLILSLAVLYKAVLFNFYESHPLLLPSEHTRLLYVGVTVALLFLAVPFALQLRPGVRETVPREGGRFAKLLAALTRHPDQVVFFIAFGLLTVLLCLEIRKAFVTLAWGLEALVVFVFALWAGVRNFRLAAIGLLLVCVARIVLDLWRFEGNSPWLTGIGLGATLILVGYMSIRFREAIRKYL
jgi:hypothetical protein